MCTSKGLSSKKRIKERKCHKNKPANLRLNLCHAILCVISLFFSFCCCFKAFNASKGDWKRDVYLCSGQELSKQVYMVVWIRCIHTHICIPYKFIYECWTEQKIVNWFGMWPAEGTALFIFFYELGIVYVYLYIFF